LEGSRSEGFDRGKGWYGGMSVGFVLLTRGTSFDVLAYIGGKAGPPEFGSDKLASFEVARVTSGFVVVAALEDSATEGIISWNIDSALVSEDTGVDLPVREAGAEWERDVLSHGL
jgi:hypothetical protein